MEYPILYSFRRCPYAMRARIALRYSKISYIHREIKLSNRPKELYNISYKGTVPVLLKIDGNVIDESMDIMYFALNYKDSKNWFKTNINKQKKLIKRNDSQFKKSLDKYKYHVRFKENTYEFYQNSISKFLREYDIILKNQNYLIDENITLGDIALFPFIRQCAHVDLNWFQNNFKNLSAWLEEFKTSDLFSSIMIKYEIWSPGDKNLIIKNE